MKRALVLCISAAALAAQANLFIGCSEDTTENSPGPGGDGDADGAAGDGNGAADGAGDGDDGSSDGSSGSTTQLGDNVAGTACNAAEDCAGTGSTCLDEVGGVMGFGGAAAPDGYCSGSCTDDAQCGEGGVCANALAALNIAGSCMKACASNGDCREGYVCVEGFSVPDGGAGGVGGQIPPQPATCQPKPETVQLADDSAGKACSGDAACGGGTCSSTIGGVGGFGGSPAPGGYCTGSCTEDAQCGAGGACIKLIPFGNQPGSCYAGCDNCAREGYACGPVVDVGSIPGGGGGFQVPEACVPVDEEPDAGAPASDGGA